MASRSTSPTAGPSRLCRCRWLPRRPCCWAITLGLLFLPKLMGLLLALIDGPRRRSLGGGLRLLASAVLETLLSALVAPMMMLLHTGFVAHHPAGLGDRLASAAAPGRPAVRCGESVRRFGWVTATRRGRVDRHVQAHACAVLLADSGLFRPAAGHPPGDVDQFGGLGRAPARARLVTGDRGGIATAGDAPARRAAGDTRGCRGDRFPWQCWIPASTRCISRCCARPTRHPPAADRACGAGTQGRLSRRGSLEQARAAGAAGDPGRWRGCIWRLGCIGAATTACRGKPTSRCRRGPHGLGKNGSKAISAAA